MVQLVSSPTSAREARRVVTRQLVDMGRPELVDDVIAVVTELVANAVIHAGAPIELSLKPAGAGVRVEVSDGSPVIPRWTPAAMSATTTSGRGLILVNRVASTWGVQAHGSGKTVWVLLDEPTGPVEESSYEELLATWADDDEPAPSPTTGTVRVVLTVDVQLMLDSRAHTEDLVRELQLLVFSQDTAPAVAPIVHLAHRLALATRAFHEGRNQMLTQTLLAAQRAQTDVTLDLRLQRDSGEAASEWLAALDEADALTDQGVLLLPPFLPELVEFRRHYIATILDRLQQRTPGGDAHAP